MKKEEIVADNNIDSAYAHLKSAAIKNRANDTKAIIIDPEKEYEDLAIALGGEVIDLRKYSPSVINVFDLADK